MVARKTKIKPEVVEAVPTKAKKTKAVEAVPDAIISVEEEASPEASVDGTLSEEDKGAIFYFIEKGDITLWKDYNDKRHLIESEHPYLWSAIKDLDKAQRRVNLELKQLGVF